MDWNKEVLKEDQYATSQNLETRIAIHTYGVNPRDFWDWVWDHYPFCEGDHILEVGCGTGQFWKAHSHRLPPRCHLTLTDFSQAMVRKSREALYAFPVHFALADVERLPFPERVFEYVVCHFMLYHASSQEMALQEIQKVLTPGGRVGFVTTSLSHMRRLWDVGREIDPGFRYESRMSTPFCEENASALLRQHFSVIEKDGYEDTLHVDNTSVVLRYVRSVLASTSTPPKEVFYQEYARYVEREIVEQGFFSIGTRVVLYTCH